MLLQHTQQARREKSASRAKSKAPRWLCRTIPLVTFAFVWSFVVAPVVSAAQALAHEPQPLGHTRKLSHLEMQRIIGANVHRATADVESGDAFSWETMSGDTNTINGNKMTQVPIVGWTARGGMPVQLTLYHNSRSTHNSELGQKWTFSFDIYGVPGVDDFSLANTFTVHWGNDLAYTFVQNMDGSWSAPTGIYDKLTSTGSPISSYDLTTKNQVKYHFTKPYSQWNCATITDKNGNVITLNHDSSDNVTSIVDPTSRTITLSYTSGKVTSITDPLSRVWSISYTSSDLTQITWPSVGGSSYNEQFAYDSGSHHNIVTHTDKRGHNWTATYNSSDNSLASETDTCSNTSTYSYSTSGSNSTTTVTDANSHAVVYNYSSKKLSSIADPLSHSDSYTYDSSFNRTQVTDRRSKVWQYTYDSAGNVLTAKDPYNHTITYTYNSHNMPLTVVDALSHTQVTNTYDSHDNKSTSTDALSHETDYSYDSHGLLSSVTDPLSHTTSYGYDTDGNLVSITDANSHETDYTVNGLGWRTGITDPLSHSTSISYDNWGRVSSITTPAGTTSTTYDACSNVLTVTDGNSHATTNTFDNDNRLLTVTKANGDVLTYSYDATGKKGLLSSFTDGNSNTTTYSYTSLNKKSSVSYPDSTSESWTYDNVGNVASQTDGKSQTISFTYDDAGRLTTRTYPNSSTVSYVYDNANRLSSMTDGTGTSSYSYDNANRLTQIAAPNGTTSYSYDAADRRTGMTLTGTGSWSYGYDAANRLTSLTNPYSETTNNSYDAANRVTSLTNGNSSVSSFTYDSANRVTDVYHKKSDTTVLAHYQYAYDYASNVTSRTDTDSVVTSFGYDASDQLTSESRDNSQSNGYTYSYTYDHNGNRATKVTGTGMSAVTDTYSYSWDKLTSISFGGGGSKSYSYDNNGNCTAVTVGSNTTSLTYDYENRITQITYPNSSTNTFAYNGNDLRTQKVDSSGTKNYVTDGTSVASPVLGDGAAIYTPGLSERRSSTSKFYHADALGSARGITDSSQNVTDTVRYDAFGMTVNRTGTNPTPFGFVGGSQYQADGDSGLMLLGHRYYDPSIGRFITRDPAKDGTNWYIYCENNPLAKTDPEGTHPWWKNPPKPTTPGIPKDPIDRPLPGYGDPPGPRDSPDPYVKYWWQEHDRINPDPARDTYPRPSGPPDENSGELLRGSKPGPEKVDPDTALRPSSNPNTEPGNGGSSGGGEGGSGGNKNPDPWKDPHKWGEVIFPTIGVAVIVIGAIALCCFDGDTPVLMADGTTKRIQDVKSGDWVLSKDISTGGTTRSRVIRTTTTEVTGSFAIHLANGETIHTTEDHLFYVPGHGFIPARDIKPQMRCQIAKRTSARVRNIEANSILHHRVYNLEVADTHSFFVGRTGVWVHDVTQRSTHSVRF